LEILAHRQRGATALPEVVEAAPSNRLVRSHLDERATHDQEEPGVASLVIRARAGDSLAFADLYVRFFHRVHRYVTKALHDPDDAEDAAQEIFAKVLAALPSTGQLREPFRVWLIRIARNHVIDRQRRAAKALTARAVELNLQAHKNVGYCVDDASDARAVGALIANLPRTQQRVLLLRYVFEFPTEEIADVLDTTPDSVRHMQMRALRALYAEMVIRDREELSSVLGMRA
jgi:RNA polymerase sigma-70 factor (ECF subfamily)